MTDKLKQAVQDFLAEWDGLESDQLDQAEDKVTALRQALDQLPDTTKMIDTGIDRGAWSDVPDATKWVDDLRGGEEFECPRCGHCCWTPEDMAYRPGGLSVEDPPNSTKPVEEPIGEIVEAHGLIAVSIPEMPPVGTKLYTAPQPAKPAQQQEPVAWLYEERGRRWVTDALHEAQHANDGVITPLYTAPQPAKPAQQQEPVAWLSRDDARLALWDAINKREFGNPTDDKLILDHLRKNGLWIGKYTSPPPKQPEQEPVAWIVPDYGFLFPNEDSAQRYLDNIESNAAPTPLYTAPPKREWQWLTYRDLQEIMDSMKTLNSYDITDIYTAVEAKLREKNHAS